MWTINSGNNIQMKKMKFNSIKRRGSMDAACHWLIFAKDNRPRSENKKKTRKY